MRCEGEPNMRVKFMGSLLPLAPVMWTLLHTALYAGFVLCCSVIDRKYTLQPPPWSWRPQVYPHAPLPQACKKVKSTVASGECTVKYILPAVGQTGTTSVIDALRLMGVRAFHLEENILFLRPALKANVTAEVWRESLRKCNVDAVSLEPSVDLFSLALEACPKAKVILTWRDHPSWLRSAASGGARKDVRWGTVHTAFSGSVRLLPWAELYDTLTNHFTDYIESGEKLNHSAMPFSTLLGWYIFGSSAYSAPHTRVYERGVFKQGFHEEAYLAHLSEVRRLTPKGQLLEFDVRKHGWKELADFTGEALPPAGTEFPHPRSKHSWTNDVLWFHAPFHQRAALVAIFSSCHWLHYLLLRWVLITIFRALLRLRQLRKGKAD